MEFRLVTVRLFLVPIHHCSCRPDNANTGLIVPVSWVNSYFPLTYVRLHCQTVAKCKPEAERKQLRIEKAAYDINLLLVSNYAWTSSVLQTGVLAQLNHLLYCWLGVGDGRCGSLPVVASHKFYKHSGV